MAKGKTSAAAAAAAASVNETAPLLGAASSSTVVDVPTAAAEDAADAAAGANTSASAAAATPAAATPFARPSLKTLLAGSLAVAATVVLLSSVAAPAALPSVPSTPSKPSGPSTPQPVFKHPASYTPAPRFAPSAARVVGHLQALERLADSKGGGSRSVATGHPASVAYVVEQLQAMNSSLRVWTEDVDLLAQVDKRPPVLSLFKVAAPRDYDGGDGDASGSDHDINDDISDDASGRVDSGIDSLRNTAGKRTDETVFAPRIDVAVAAGSGPGSVLEGRLRLYTECAPPPTAPPAALGHKDRSEDPEEWVAVIGPRPTPGCTLCDRITSAVRAGARGIILYAVPGGERGYPHSLPPSPGSCARNPTNARIMGRVPIVSLSDSAAFKLLERMSDVPPPPPPPPAPPGRRPSPPRRRPLLPQWRVDLDVHSAYTRIVSKNVLAESLAGKEDPLSSFHESDLAKNTVQKVRFAWWTGEEIGLLGSKYYVANLQAADSLLLSRHKLNIDTDMIASPNYVRGIWDGSAITNATLARRCASLFNLFASWFLDQDLPVMPFPFNGRSDFQPFLDAGVPAAGVITGEDEIKTPEQAALFGGVPGLVLDPCYHQDCDRVKMVEQGPARVILEQNVAVLGYVLDVVASAKDIDDLLDNGPAVAV
ncbi:hypothetical protein BC831DRAFT_472185 [Entophlyctis helioformis]|nr:hypothetical protein BC831DRAFT_472185 [Entophlyctis helioformis]